jgi:mRNA interferase MazF
MVRIEPDSENWLSKPSAIDTFQIRSISTKLLLRKIGSVSTKVLGDVKTAIKAVIDAD